MLEKVLEIGDFRQNKKALKSFKIKEYQGFSVGALQGIRTPDLLVRSQTLYPAELAAQMRLKYSFDRRNIIPPTAENVNRFFDIFYCAEISVFRQACGKGKLWLSAAGAKFSEFRHFTAGASPRPTLL